MLLEITGNAISPLYFDTILNTFILILISIDIDTYICVLWLCFIQIIKNIDFYTFYDKVMLVKKYNGNEKYDQDNNLR